MKGWVKESSPTPHILNLRWTATEEPRRRANAKKVLRCPIKLVQNRYQLTIFKTIRENSFKFYFYDCTLDVAFVVSRNFVQILAIFIDSKVEVFGNSFNAKLI